MKRRFDFLINKELAAIVWQLVGLVSIVIGFSSPTEAKEKVDCISQKVTFDGVVTLHYAKVSHAGVSPLALHPQYPVGCADGRGQLCKGDGSIASEETLAIGKTCGHWAYVEYISDRNVMKGWVDASRLVLVPKKLPSDVGLPPDKNTLFVPTRIRMKLIQGQGIPVCEAYLQRLNQTVFHEPPYCGRPENDQVPGFSLLNRVALSGTAYRRLYGHFDLFRASGNSHAGEDVSAIYDRNVHSVKADVESWGYDPKIDIENADSLANLVVWSQESGFPACGDRHQQTGPDVAPEGARGSQLIIALNPQGSEVDEPKTANIFGDHGKSNSPDNLGKSQFRPIGSSMSIFEYRGVYYFDTFFDGNGWPDFEGERTTEDLLKDHLAVFVHQRGATRQICEYFYDDSTKRTPFTMRQE